MNSKIEGCGVQSATIPASRVKSAEKAGTGGGAASVEAVARPDSIALTGEAQYLQKLEKAVTSAPDISAARVAEVRERLRDGSYQIDAHSIAAKLARLEWELGDT